MDSSIYKYRDVGRHILFFALLLLVLPAVCQANKTVTDQLGRQVTLPDDPLRIVALAPNITEMVYAINQGHRMVGATQFSDFPEAAKSLPKVGSYVHLDIERIVALKPDLCLATKDGNPIEIISVLESLDIPIYAVNPRNLNTIMETLTELGVLLNARENARQVVCDMTRRIEKIEAAIQKTNSRPRVFYQIGISPIVSAGTDTCIHQLIEMAGGANIARGPASYPRFSYEQILGLAPDIIIITSMAKGAVFESVKKQWMQWPDIPAVKNQQVMLANSDILDRPTPRLVDGLEFLAAIIHPELFKDTTTP